MALEQQIKIAENFNDRAVLLFIRGMTEEALIVSQKAIDVNPKNLEAFINRALMRWKLAHFTDEDLLTYVTEEGKHLPPPAYEFCKHMVKYGIGYNYQDEDLSKLGGVESTSFEGTQAKIIRAVKRYVDMMRRDRASLVLPSEARLIPQEDHVHQIYISNDEKSMAFVTCDAFIVAPVLPSLILNEPSEVRIPFPESELLQEEEQSHRSDDSLKQAPEGQKNEESV